MGASVRTLWTGRNWISRTLIACAIFGAAIMAYWFATGADREIARIREECSALGNRLWPSDDTEARIRIVKECEDKFIRQRRERNQ